MLILEDLYLGDIHPSERSFKKNSQYAKALNEVVKAGDELIGTLTEKQKEISNIQLDEVAIPQPFFFLVFHHVLSFSLQSYSKMLQTPSPVAQKHNKSTQAHPPPIHSFLS